MQLQDAPATYFFKLWPWIEANKYRLIAGVVVIALAGIGIYGYVSWRKSREFDAGMALTQLMLSDSRNNTVEHQAGLFMKVAGDYPGTTAGQRAMLQSAGMLFETRKYADAQAQFQQFLNQYPGGALASQAALGVAACLDAQSNMEPATAAYQRVVNSYSDPLAANYARYRLAQIDEQQGKWTDALNLYEDVARSNPGSPLGSEAGMRAMELKMKLQPASSSSTPAAPFKLNP